MKKILKSPTQDVLSDTELMKAIKKGREDVKRGRLISLEEVKRILHLNNH